jgi:hypothetical protein
MKPFLQGRKSLAIAALRPANGAPLQTSGSCRAGANGQGPAAHSAGSSVEVLKEGDKVVRIVVTCTCGERTEVECLYAPGS